VYAELSWLLKNRDFTHNPRSWCNRLTTTITAAGFYLWVTRPACTSNYRLAQCNSKLENRSETGLHGLCKILHIVFSGPGSFLKDGS
jgi:hypothetical protein